MLFILHFRTNQLTLPLNYHGKVQGLLYKLIQGFPDYSDFLHDTGYSDGGKQFKLFCFSDLTGPHHLRGKTIIFPQRFSFQLRTADPILGDLLYQALMQEQSYQLGNQQIWLERVETTRLQLEAQQVKLRMASPITVYASLPDGKTRYYNPLDPEFSRGVNDNYRAKWRSATGTEAPGDVSLITLSVGQRDKCVTQIKGTWVNAWYGTYLLKGSPQAIQFLYHTGLGAKNSMGFGLFDIVK